MQTGNCLFELQANMARAIAHPLRIAVMDYLADGQQCVCDIAEAVGSERSNVSKHLSIMVQAEVLSSHKDGLKMMYEIKTQCAVQFLACLRAVIIEQTQQQAQMFEQLR